MLHPLISTAMRGTSNSSNAEILKALVPLGVDLPAGDAESTLLGAAAVAGVAQLAGYIPATHDATIEPSKAETAKRVNDASAQALKRILSGEFEPVLPEFLHLAGQRGLVLPPETLPAVLGLGKNELRALVPAVIGARGRWLAAQNPAWAYALGRSPEDAWEHGTCAERVAAMESIRAVDAGRARQMVQTTWEQDAPEERAAFIATFGAGLSMDDESLLEGCLDDKRKEVRDAARSLLSRMEQSGLVRRTSERLEPLLKLKSKFLGSDSLEVSLPEKLDAAAKRDGAGGAILRKKMGEKANWLAQMLAVEPPSVWSKKWNKPPEKLISAALGSEWKDSVLLGWWQATATTRDPAWAEAFTSFWLKQDAGRTILGSDGLGDIVGLLNGEQIEVLTKASITPLVSELLDASPMLQVLIAYKRPWTAKTARTAVQSAQRLAGKYAYTLPQALPQMGLWMPPELAAEFGKGWPSEPVGQWRTRIDEFLALLNFRNEIRQSLGK